MTAKPRVSDERLAVLCEVEGPCDVEWQGDTLVIVGQDIGPKPDAPLAIAGAQQRRRVYSIPRKMLGELHVYD